MLKSIDGSIDHGLQTDGRSSMMDDIWTITDALLIDSIQDVIMIGVYDMNHSSFFSMECAIREWIDA